MPSRPLKPPRRTDPSRCAALRRILILSSLPILWISLSAGLGCVAASPEPPGELSERPAPKAPGPLRHWPLDPERLETALRSDPIEVLSERYAGAGLTGASRVELRLLEAGLEISAKWKPMPPGFDGINNSPRKELAAYEVQKLVLDPSDYVVPTSVARCLPASAFPDPTEHVEERFPGSRCELGVLSVWLENVTLPEQLLDVKRFEENEGYARHLARFNLVTYLILHQDGRRGNFLVSTDPEDRRVFAVDNGVAFSGIWYNWFVPNWKRIRVPALDQRSFERMRELDAEDLESLAVVAELRRLPDGMLVPVPAGPIRERDEGVRIDGPTLQLGLTEDEIENLFERIEELIEEVEEGDLSILPPPGSREDL